MKKMILLGALAVSFATTSTQGQSVEELLGLNVSAIQTPANPTMTGHAQAEEAPLYFRAKVNPLLVGSISLQDAGSSGGTTTISGAKVEFDVGIGFGLSFGWRIPESYVFIQIDTGFQWAGVNDFNGTLTVGGGGGGSFDLKTSGGNLYQVPVLITPGLEFDLGGQWPFLNGAAVRFGPSVGFMYYNLKINDIEAVAGPVPNNDIFDINGNGLVFTYGAMVNLDLFLSHNVALTLGWQLQATSPIDYGQFNVDQGSSGTLSDAKTNFTFTNVMSCGISIYF
jgi:hypothetical protein